MKLTRVITIIFFFAELLVSDCIDLNYDQCIQYAGFCEWNQETSQCENIGGGGGEIEYGPYQYQYLTESDGIRISSFYNGALLYYPQGAPIPYHTIVLIDAFGDEYGLEGWAQFYASHGYVAISIGNFDRRSRDLSSNWDYEDRAIALIDAVETVKYEQHRNLSPLYGLIDTTSFAVSGYSTSGGGAHAAVTMESTLKTAVLLNPAAAFLDSLNCPIETAYYCLREEHLNHETPVLIFAGENELDGLVSDSDSTYLGMWALVQYNYIPETTDKSYFESAGQGHGSSTYPVGPVADYSLAWLNYYLRGENSSCDYLIQEPENVSEFITTLECSFLPSFDLNDDGSINISDFVTLLISIINEDGLIEAKDFNFDSNVDIYDLLIISDYLDNQ